MRDTPSSGTAHQRVYSLSIAPALLSPPSYRRSYRLAAPWRVSPSLASLAFKYGLDMRDFSSLERFSHHLPPSPTISQVRTRHA